MRSQSQNAAPIKPDRLQLLAQIRRATIDDQKAVQDSDATLNGLPSGATVKIRVTSANDAGESAPGPEASVMVA